MLISLPWGITFGNGLRYDFSGIAAKCWFKIEEEHDVLRTTTVAL